MVPENIQANEPPDAMLREDLRLNAASHGSGSLSSSRMANCRRPPIPGKMPRAAMGIFMLRAGKKARSISRCSKPAPSAGIQVASADFIFASPSAL